MVILWSCMKKIALAHLIIFLFGMFTLTNCSTGWSVGGYELSPQDTTNNTVFIEIVSHDSTVHWYSEKIFDGDNWCFKHSKWEDVRIY